MRPVFLVILFLFYRYIRLIVWVVVDRDTSSRLKMWDVNGMNHHFRFGRKGRTLHRLNIHRENHLRLVVISRPSWLNIRDLSWSLNPCFDELLPLIAWPPKLTQSDNHDDEWKQGENKRPYTAQRTG